MKIIGYTEAGHYTKKYLVEMSDSEIGRITGLATRVVHADATPGSTFSVEALASKVDGIRRVHADAVNAARYIRDLADILESEIPAFARPEKPKEGTDGR